MNVAPTDLPEVVEIRPVRHGDHRGWFSEVFRADAFRDAGILATFVQDNESFSGSAGTLRGIHYQIPPCAQSKLVRVIQGSIFDVAVDLRRGSPTFGAHVGVTLTADAGNQLFVPAGFGHGFCTLVPDTRVGYKVTAPYAPDHERSVRWDDPTLRIDWPMPVGALTLSARDEAAPLLTDQRDLFDGPPVPQSPRSEASP